MVFIRVTFTRPGLWMEVRACHIPSASTLTEKRALPKGKVPFFVSDLARHVLGIEFIGKKKRGAVSDPVREGR